jgi:hypothetical protein
MTPVGSNVPVNGTLSFLPSPYTVGPQSSNKVQVTIPFAGSYSAFFFQALNNDNSPDAFAFRVISSDSSGVTVQVSRLDQNSGWGLNLQVYVMGVSTYTGRTKGPG